MAFQMSKLFGGEPISSFHALQPSCPRGVHIHAHQLSRTNNPSKLLQHNEMSKTIDDGPSATGARGFGNDSMTKIAALFRNELGSEILKALAVCRQPAL